MVTFAPTYGPRELRVEHAVQEIRERLRGKAPTDELYRELAERYEVIMDELGQAWIRAGLA
jgi:hypothetical protein